MVANLKIAFEEFLEQQRQEPEMIFSIMVDLVDLDDMDEEYDVLSNESPIVAFRLTQGMNCSQTIIIRN